MISLHKVFVGIGIGALLFAGYFFLFRSTEEKITNDLPQGTAIIAFGDSLVEGVGAPPGSDFPSILSRRLGVTILNRGVSGDTSETALRRLGRDVLEEDPKIVIVLIGGNDVLRRIPPEDTVRNVREIIRSIHERGAAVILAGVRGGIFVDSLKDDFQKIAEDTGSLYVPDVLRGLLGDSRFMSDAVHPNASGYEIIANKLEPSLRRLID